jgi:hypothetical protein
MDDFKSWVKSVTFNCIIRINGSFIRFDDLGFSEGGSKDLSNDARIASWLANFFFRPRIYSLSVQTVLSYFSRPTPIRAPCFEPLLLYFSFIAGGTQWRNDWILGAVYKTSGPAPCAPRKPGVFGQWRSRRVTFCKDICLSVFYVVGPSPTLAESVAENCFRPVRDLVWGQSSTLLAYVMKYTNASKSVILIHACSSLEHDANSFSWQCSASLPTSEPPTSNYNKTEFLVVLWRFDVSVF